jgi:hypothetical protein
MPSIHDATNAMQIHVQKLKAQVFVVDFYFLKSKGDNIQMQDVMDH